MEKFNYQIAFQRNLGFLNKEEQEKLRGARVAIAGLGGTGGAQVAALARLGIGTFNLADPDTFELANFNRQIGATMETIGQHKVDVATNIVLGVNPEADVKHFMSGVSPDNIGVFLEGVDAVVDSLDFYCFKERFLLYKNARERGIWVLTAPPLGFGCTILIFSPTGMTFEEYFGFHEVMSQRELEISLIAGIAPQPFLLKYLHKGGMDIGAHQLPSVGAAPFMIAGMIATEVMNLITGKRPVITVPTIQQFDALLHKYSIRTYRMGMRSPIQRLKKMIIDHQLPR